MFYYLHRKVVIHINYNQSSDLKPMETSMYVDNWSTCSVISIGSSFLPRIPQDY